MATVTIENTHHRKACRVIFESDNGDENLLSAYYTVGLDNAARRKVHKAWRQSVDKDRIDIAPGDFLTFSGEKDEDGHYSRYFDQVLKFARQIQNDTGSPDVSFLTATVVE